MLKISFSLGSRIWDPILDLCVKQLGVYTQGVQKQSFSGTTDFGSDFESVCEQIWCLLICVNQSGIYDLV